MPLAKNGGMESSMKNKNEIIYVLKETWKYDKKVFIFMLAYTVCDFAIPYIYILLPYFVINDYIERQQSVQILLGKTVIMIVGLLLLGYIKDYARKEFWPRVINVRKQFIHQLDDVVMRMEYVKTENPQILDKVEKASEALASNEQGVEGILNRIFRVGGSLIGFLVYSYIVIKLSIVIHVWLLISGVLVYNLTRGFDKKKYDCYSELYSSGRKLKYLYNISSEKKYAKEIRSYGLWSWIVGKRTVLMKERDAILNKLEGKKLCLVGIRALDFLLKNIIIYAYIVYSVINGTISLAEFTLYSSALLALSEAFGRILQSITELKEQSRYVRDFMDFVQSNSTSGENIIKNSKEYLVNNIRFQDVSFIYPESSKKILDRVTFEIKKGEKIALVGKNGAGKTTLVKLLTGLYTSTEGDIFINNKPVQQYGEDYFKMFSVVFQESKILAFSIKENIALNSNDGKDIEVKQVLDQVGLKRLYKNGIEVNMLKDLDEQGIELSGGELQRFITARAIFKNAPIIVFDEPTAALDPIAEDKLYNNFASITDGKIVIFISHRLASTRFCDRIMFIDEGRITEMGTHSELLELNGNYAELFNKQAKYYV